ncbi:MAG: FAD-dependent oxidoreductase [Parachlamydiales bacterium]|nr:FAD-dependent oxidoreductase [Parachlamydiales bacterium]
MMIFWRAVITCLCLIGSRVDLPSTSPKENIHPVVILGSGISGQTAALNLLRGGLTPLIIEGPDAGGVLKQSPQIENWPGEKKISGWELVSKIRTQIEELGAQFLPAEVVDIDFSQRPYKVFVQNSIDAKPQVILAENCIIAMGSSPRRLHIPGEEKFWTNGVYNCALCDGGFFHQQKVAVVGGGDSAIIEADYLSNIAQEVYLIVRRDMLKGHGTARFQNLAKKPNVTVLYNTQIEKILETDGEMVGIEIQDVKNHVTRPLLVKALFEAIGHVPNTAIFQGKLPLDPEGYIRLKRGNETSLSGVFAVGDIAHPLIKQALNAASSGANAAIQILHDHGSSQTIAHLMKKDRAPSQGSSVGLLEVSNPQEMETILQETKTPVFVDFYAPWCGPCRYLMPLLEEKSSVLQGKIRIVKVNVDRQHELTEKYQIRSMPTLILFDRHGKEIAKKQGYTTIQGILQKLETMENSDDIDRYLNSLQ